jgi:hypothetical protein
MKRNLVALAAVTALCVVIVACTAKSHRATITRIFGSDTEAALLAIAEMYVPANPELASLIQDCVDLGNCDSEDPDDENLWWYDSFDGVRIPYAVTSDAVDYYADLVAQWQVDPSTSWGGEWTSSNLQYVGVIEYADAVEIGGEQFDDVYVVDMNLSWSAVCGSLSAYGFDKMRTIILSLGAHGFDKMRTVILSPAGDILRVYGDGVTPFWVS